MAISLELKLNLRLSQQLVMTPQLQQAIKLLQLSRLELQNTIQQELVENPILEEAAEEESGEATEGENQEPAEEAAAPSAEEAPDPAAETREPSTDELVSDVDWENYMESRPLTSGAQGPDDRPSLEASISLSVSLSDHLLWQLGLTPLSELEREIGVLIVGNLNDDGYLQEKVEAIAEQVNAPVEEVESVRHLIQEFDPVGVASIDLSDCLLVQMRVLGVHHPLAIKIVQEHLDLLQRKDYRGIGRIEDVPVEEVADAARLIGSFEPRPGRQFVDEEAVAGLKEPIYITPDIFVQKLGDEYHVILNEDGMPRLKVSNAYRAVLRGGEETKATKEYVREKLRSAQWLIKSIHQRQRTISKVMDSILRFQRPFFDRGPEFLRPLNLRDVADDIGMHESTVSRVTTNKYAQTPHGVFELKFFFNSSIRTSDGDGIASESVKEKITRIIKAEDPCMPLSDQKIAEMLAESDIHIARRTVTKYREALRILASTKRKQIS
jgi:RNA polymerase sigma-54 factor